MQRLKKRRINTVGLIKDSPEDVSEFQNALSPEGLGAWREPYLIDAELAEHVFTEVHEFGTIESIRESGSSVRQIFRRMIIDLTKENNFPKTEELGLRLGGFAVANLVDRFPAVAGLSIDEAAVQIYPENTELGLGWHRDHPADDLVVVSASLTGSGQIGFSSLEPDVAKKKPLNEVIETTMYVDPLDAVFFRSTGLYEHEVGININPTHAVTQIYEGSSRFTIQYRMNVNAADYGNKPVNHDKRPYEVRKKLIQPT